MSPITDYFKKLRGYLGQQITVQISLCVFCTEENEPKFVDERKQKELMLTLINIAKIPENFDSPDRLGKRELSDANSIQGDEIIKDICLVGKDQEGKTIIVPFNDFQSGIDSFSHRVITSICANHQCIYFAAYTCDAEHSYFDYRPLPSHQLPADISLVI